MTALINNNDQNQAGISCLSALCKAAGDELRLQILRVLQRDAFGVLELAKMFGIRQPAMSHHLKVLAKAALVVTRKEGTHIFYRRNINDGSELALLREQIFTQLDTCELPSEVLDEVALIHEHRSNTSKNFFKLNAQEFRQQQDLIASFSLYGDAVLELLETERQKGAKSVLEIGPGEGELLAALVPRFEQVIALDNSSAMLERAEALVGKELASSIHFILGETNSQAAVETAVDCTTLNMVLHHVATPVDMLKDIYELLNPGGALIVTELCQHDQDWVRDTCGDLWLGFCPEELSIWAREIGFKTGESVYMAQRNGFKIQLRKFHK
ncbi:MAG: metalloregulator ArsR/SmtB family transcription factor [Porticoccaceae bacterium]|nr:metalloregulator ArsR/SmtB family transcription factor [Porticoccaceae bacterium]